MAALTDFACDMAAAQVHTKLDSDCNIMCQPTDLEKDK